jgi:hypothetical protein
MGRLDRGATKSMPLAVYGLWNGRAHCQPARDAISSCDSQIRHGLLPLSPGSERSHCLPYRWRDAKAAGRRWDRRVSTVENVLGRRLHSSSGAVPPYPQCRSQGLSRAPQEAL